jgi:hypothetical protein
LMKVIRGQRHVHVEGRVNVFAQEAGTVRRRLDCDVQGHSIFFLCLDVGGKVRATRRHASIEGTYQERLVGVPGVSGSEPRKAGGAYGRFAQACRARQRRAVVGWRASWWCACARTRCLGGFAAALMRWQSMGDMCRVGAVGKSWICDLLNAPGSGDRRQRKGVVEANSTKTL